VECLKHVGAWLLAESQDFKAVVEVLQGSVNPVVAPAELDACRLEVP
jgi:hypothetical protein